VHFSLLVLLHTTESSLVSEQAHDSTPVLAHVMSQRALQSASLSTGGAGTIISPGGAGVALRV
jgi:hypothetical protein